MPLVGGYVVGRVVSHREAVMGGVLLEGVVDAGRRVGLIEEGGLLVS